MGTTARKTLHKVHRFLDHAGQLEVNEAELYADLVEASIVFARSITFHLQKEFAHSPGFDEWWTEKRIILSEDKLSSFFLELRNVILKEGPPTMVRHIRAVDAVALAVAESNVHLKIVRAEPWWRRSIKITIADSRHVVTQFMRERFQAFCRQLKPYIKSDSPPTGSVTVSQHWYFDHRDWKDQGATDLLREYLTRLEPLIQEAERRFTAMR